MSGRTLSRKSFGVLFFSYKGGKKDGAVVPICYERCHFSTSFYGEKMAIIGGFCRYLKNSRILKSNHVDLPNLEIYIF